MNLKVSHIDLLEEMLAIPAVSRNEQARSDFLEGYLRGMNFPVTRIRHNLLVGDPDANKARPNILLNSHMDTVAPVDGWDHDPYIPVRDDHKIVGLGSNDAGASVVSLIAVYERWNEILNEKLNLMLLISTEEEVSGSNGISSVLDHLGTLDGVIVGEPTGMRPAVAERGLMVLDGKVQGKAGHAARNGGENAIYNAIKDIESIAGLEFPHTSEWLPEPGAQVTMISAGTGHNVVPDQCHYVVDVRSNDQYGNELLLEMIRSVCMADLTPRSTRLKPSCLDPGHFLMKSIEHAGWKPIGSSTLSDMALIPYPAVKLGPGDSARSHTANEYILLNELDQAIVLYGRFLESMATVIKEHNPDRAKTM